MAKLEVSARSQLTAATNHNSELRKDPAAKPVYDKWFDMLETSAYYSEVADWLNEIAFRAVPYADSDTWERDQVRGVTLNPILKGMRERNNKKSKRISKTGIRFR